MAAHPSGSADWTVRIWEIATGWQLGVLRGHEYRIWAVAWWPDGERIATGCDDRTVRVWNADTREEMAIVGAHQGKVTSAAWSGDGRHLLTASVDGTARIWSADRTSIVYKLLRGTECSGRSPSKNGALTCY
ncbi:WD40 repeat domain-containing protein [Amycolatopsis taiwanensis]|uniref:Anaphase-promoting complex subunit 4 WD40 domain-containing protein n=1 Tax=Amycolatopsis taiwanensis TaxID=342230 RepID=A0A9W6RC61_9PSEU|nr:hypothetical protein [Amycolatopsis taiwanensis]GLY71352.1 hypothetical protein Atai01_79710 [Amycolatopsis taiwanensis]